MDLKDFFNSLSKKHRREVLNIALPGIDEYLENILCKENLSSEAESLRELYVEHISVGLEHERFPTQTLLNRASNRGKCNSKLQRKPETQPSCDSRATGVNSSSHINGSHSEQGFEKIANQEIVITDETVEDSQQELLQLQQNPAFLSISGSEETLQSDSSNECEVIESDNDVNYNNDMDDESYTVDSTEIPFLANIDSAEEEGIYSNYLYVKGDPGWYKRWCILHRTCLRCFKRKKDFEAILEVPLCGAKCHAIENTGRRMFAFVILQTKTDKRFVFGTSNETSRTEWLAVVNYLIGRLHATIAPSHVEVICTDMELIETSSEVAVTGSIEKLQGNDLEHEQHVRPNLGHVPQSRRDWVQNNATRDWLEKCRHDNSEEMSCMTNSDSKVTLEKSFQELEQCLPEILQGGGGGGRPTSNPPQEQLDKVIVNNNMPDVVERAIPKRSESFNKPRLSTGHSRTLSSSYTNLDSGSLSTNHQKGSKVKRTATIASEFTKKATKVRSKINWGFRKMSRVKSDNMLSRPVLERNETITMTGSLWYKNGLSWKKRLCVVQGQIFFVFKENLNEQAEFEFPLSGSRVFVQPEELNRPFSIKIKSPVMQEMYFATDNEEDLEEWTVVLEAESKLPVMDSTRSLRSPDNSETTSPRDEEVFAHSSPLSSPTSSASPGDNPLSTALPLPSTSDKEPSGESGFFEEMHSDSEHARLRCAGELFQKNGSSEWTKVWVTLEDGMLHVVRDKKSNSSLPLPMNCCVYKSTSEQDKPFCFEVTKPGMEDVILSAQNIEDYKKWTNILNETSKGPASLLLPGDMRDHRSSIQMSEEAIGLVGEEGEVFYPNGTEEVEKLFHDIQHIGNLEKKSFSDSDLPLLLKEEKEESEIAHSCTELNDEHVSEDEGGGGGDSKSLTDDENQEKN